MIRDCAFGRVLEQKVINTQECVDKIDKRLGEFETNISNKMTELFNHQSSRLPMSITILITILSSIVVGLVVAMVK